MMHLNTIVIVVLIMATLIGCSHLAPSQGTLGDIDIIAPPNNRSEMSEIKLPPKKPTEQNTDVAKKAYYDYLQNAAKDDTLRVKAATRLAELELSSTPENSDLTDDAKIRATIALLHNTLKDFPEAEGNDQVMYQLAKAYDQLGDGDQANQILTQMLQSFPRTPYFAEAKFRIAENLFIRGQFMDAELAYTDVLQQHNSTQFLEKSFFKRGWCRYKQELYNEALEDFYAAIDKHNFAAPSALNDGEKELYNEYFRSTSLAFQYLGGPSALSQYFTNPNHPQLFASYSALADLQLKQKQYSDAVQTYRAFRQAQPDHPQVVQASVAAIEIWKNYKFFDEYQKEFEQFFSLYAPSAAYWTQPNRSEQAKQLALSTAREHLLLLAQKDHQTFVKTGQSTFFSQARQGYERYLKEFKNYAQQDKAHQLYANLLEKAGDPAQALLHYEQAAYNDTLVLDKESAYNTLYLTQTLAAKTASTNEKNTLIQKHLVYVRRYAETYPGEPQTTTILQSAIQMAYKANALQDAVALSKMVSRGASSAVLDEATLLRAQALFDLTQYAEAEQVYRDILAAKTAQREPTTDLQNKLALSIYKQAEQAKQKTLNDEAATLFLKVFRDAPQSELAPLALIDASALYSQAGRWGEVIESLTLFKKQYPKHKLESDATKQLSVAYLKTDRNLEAAKQFEQLAGQGNQDQKMLALWQAAELYRTKKDWPSALRAYGDYAQQFPTPYAPYMEAMQHLVTIYQQTGDATQQKIWLNRMVNADQNATSAAKTERTGYLTASAAFGLAQLKQLDFNNARLSIPFETSLKTKKTLMQETLKLYGTAASQGHLEFVTQSTFAIADMYQTFSKALNQSDRPNNLSADELDQYNILLEDQAFAFEDKAIEFHQTNVRRIATGVYDPAIKKSLIQLKTLFPARYARTPKYEPYFRETP